jgi:NADPH:quinone reductase-like Zn-dependent oxidoreductase
VAIGDDVTRWTVGDRVFGLVHDGGLGELVVADEELLMPSPAGLAPRDAAAIPEVFITAHDGLCQGGLSRGDTLLVTGASGAVGTAAVQLGVQMGARVIAVARSEAGRDRLKQLGAEPFPDHAELPRAELPFRDGVDVVIELVGARNMRSNLAALRSLGRIVFIAAQGDEDVCFNLREFKTKRATVIGSTLRRRGRTDKVAAVRTFERAAMPLVASGQLRASVGHVVPADDAAEAFDVLGTPGRSGKVLVDFT